MLVLREITDAARWNSLAISAPFFSFLQSWEWGEFQKKEGVKIFRLGVFDAASREQSPANAAISSSAVSVQQESSSTPVEKPSNSQFPAPNSQEPLAIFLLLKIPARRGIHFLLPHGPLFLAAGKEEEILRTILPELRELAKKEGAGWLRVCPALPATPENAALFKRLGARWAPMHAHAESTWLLDLRKPEEELLKEMRKGTRYLIRKAEKARAAGDLEIREEEPTPAAAEEFFRWHRQHAAREKGGYAAFSRGFFADFFAAFSASLRGVYDEAIHSLEEKQGDGLPRSAQQEPSPLTQQSANNNQFSEKGRGNSPTVDSNPSKIQNPTSNTQLLLLSSFRDGKKIASLAAVFFGRFGAYYLGVSSPEVGQSGAAHLLQFEAARRARAAGCEFWNFWGVVPAGQEKKHPLRGPSLFKKGFGGFGVELLHARDFVFSWRRYLPNLLIESWRRRRRGFPPFPKEGGAPSWKNFE